MSILLTYNITKVASRRDWKRFIDVPWIVNLGDANWVPPLKRAVRQCFDFAHNPFWQYAKGAFFLVHKDGRSVGRIAAIVLELDDQATVGYFGFLEAIDDPRVFKLLLETAEIWLKEQGRTQVIGPMNPSINYELGVLTAGFEFPPYFMLSHNPSYYDRHIQACGYGKHKDFHSYLLTEETFVKTEKSRRVMAYLRQRAPIEIRSVNPKDFHAELKILREIYNDAFGHHWGFVPMTEAEFEYMARDMQQIMDPELILVLEYNHEPAGFLLCLPNVNEIFAHIRSGNLFPLGFLKFLYYRRHVSTIRVLTVAIKEKFRTLGLGGFLYAEIAARCLQKGYKRGEMSWVIEDNVMMNKLAREMGGVAYKTYRLYQKV